MGAFGLRDPIVALSSAPGPAARAVVRVAGEGAWELCAELFEPLPKRPWRLASGALRLPGWPDAPCWALCARGPRSYTGQDQVELWLPGAPPLVAALLAALQARGARLADRGEFTRRAYQSGRLDLVQVEAVLALTAAANAEEASQALRALEGGVGHRLEALKQEVLEVVAHVEAAIDFSEEELDLAADEALAARLERVARDLEEQAASAGRRAPREHLPRVALRGPPNAGKSTLFNLLTQGRALVSSRAGTTRDALEGRWRCGARELLLLDTAGTGAEPGGELERAAEERAEQAGAAADLVVWVSARGEPAPAGALWVASQRDREDAPPLAPGALPVCAPRREGLAELEAAVLSRLGGAGGAVGSARQAARLREAHAALGRASELLRSERPDRAELAALDLSLALEALGRVTGEVTSEDVLGRIFASFCVGK